MKYNTIRYSTIHYVTILYRICADVFDDQKYKANAYYNAFSADSCCHLVTFLDYNTSFIGSAKQ